jgi:integrase/recombinase XerD
MSVRQPVSELIQEYLFSLKVERSFSEHSLRAYAGDLELFQTWLAAEQIELEQLDNRGMRADIAYLAEPAKALETKPPKSDSPEIKHSTATVNRRLSAVRSFLRWLSDQRIFNATALLSKGLKNPHHLPRVISERDRETLLEDVPTDDPVSIRDAALLELMYATGARISELAALRTTDIKLEEMLIHLQGKGRKERIVPFHKEAFRKLTRYLSEARGQLIQTKKLKEGEALRVFIGVHGRPMSADSIRVVFKRCLAKAGLDSTLSPHDMRHSFATDMLIEGADLRSVQELLGHEHLATTQIYTHLSTKELKERVHKAHPRAEI